ncbi:MULTISPECIES: MerR family transcriptional regulator [unclassified Novosphingobium]|uniref:MerR family transcriptional regulator n=1 Tax=unclassified Novosphingobium TaxID=2644732 RepID=UPI000D313A82|nr:MULTISPECIES: MerR family transcriptional regulator [unclassified Novosphingobium]PTR09850.1 DNA-binding transcriptional MerR regulator [Novosphingobium sp. GV055]PUB02637.1 DNA-binding transcriptional MerR regulator [Novosphingobium sp. GV061]PUB19582.1 DNA-binding transcriptional MerR regulator [Novosphingobium sp. GV079]PUB41006.1 DNA-binding transcriptional MerR regulator [Novosphingobium sp. GV027]
MDDSLAIDDVVRRTGLTARALRFYEARGLLAPLRTQSGRRWYGPADLERIHRIVALKKAGLSLAEIKRLFDRKPIDLAALLSAQRERLVQQAAEITEALTLIDSALSRVGRGEPLDAATLCSLIRKGDTMMTDGQQAWKAVLDRYYTAEEQSHWQAAMPAAAPFDQAAYHAQWQALGRRIEAMLPLDPASDAALALVREWLALLEPFTRQASPMMWEGASRLYADMDNWQGEADPGFSKQVWDFIAAAAAAARKAGKDIGPLPAFMAPPA